MTVQGSTPIPRPRARVATGTLTDTKAVQRTARPALTLAGGDSFAWPPTSACAGTQPGGHAIPITRGQTAVCALRLEPQPPRVTFSGGARRQPTP